MARTQSPTAVHSNRHQSLWRIALDLMTAHRCYRRTGQRNELWPGLKDQLRNLSTQAVQKGWSDDEFRLRAKAVVTAAREGR